MGQGLAGGRWGGKEGMCWGRAFYGMPWLWQEAQSPGGTAGRPRERTGLTRRGLILRS